MGVFKCKAADVPESMHKHYNHIIYLNDSERLQSQR